ncbi:MAG: TAXI family TRAP transporter solute-binding subunit [Deltaproteobacteria bacterium]|nr:TAXI family TRAP transporter solute-binding subunit [Candidatus Zymogenaceae bacterium]
MKRIVFLLCTLILIPCLPLTGSAQELVLSAGPIDGSSWALGINLSISLEERTGDQGITLTVNPSEGYVDNISRLKHETADLALVDSLTAYLGTSGKSSTKLRSLGVVGMVDEHILLSAHRAREGTLADLTDSVVFLGSPGDMDREGAQMMLSTADAAPIEGGGYGWDPETAAELVIDGSLDGAFLPGIAPYEPVTHVRRIMGDDVVIMPIEGEIADKLTAAYPIWRPVILAAGTYPDQSEPIVTVARPVYLVASASLPKKTVTALLEGLYPTDPYTTEFSPVPIPLSACARSNVLPLHPGAVEFYRSRGIAPGGGK